MNGTFEFDFMPTGLAIKNARKKKGLTREQFAEQLDITPRHLQSMETEGQITPDSQTLLSPTRYIFQLYDLLRPFHAGNAKQSSHHMENLADSSGINQRSYDKINIVHIRDFPAIGKQFFYQMQCVGYRTIRYGKLIPLSDLCDTAGSSRQSRSLSVARQISVHASMVATCRAYRVKNRLRLFNSPAPQS